MSNRWEKITIEELNVISWSMTEYGTNKFKPDTSKMVLLEINEEIRKRGTGESKLVLEDKDVNHRNDPVLIKCMGVIIRTLYYDSEEIKELLENIQFHTIIKDYAMKELYRLGLIQNYCFETAVELTQKGRQLVRDAIDEILNKKMELKS